MDLGAESTRPGATPIDADEELRRLVPVLERLVEAGVRYLSVDTYKAEVAETALHAGAAIKNPAKNSGQARTASSVCSVLSSCRLHQAALGGYSPPVLRLPALVVDEGVA